MPVRLIAFVMVAWGCSGDERTQEGATRADGARRRTFPRQDESNQNPCFSPEGTFLVFTRFENGYNRGPAHLFRLDLADGAEPQQLTEGDYDDVNVPYGCFDRQSGRVVFASDRAEANDLWTINPDPTQPDLQRLSDHGELPVWIEPVFAPDATQIAMEVDTEAGTEDAQRAAIVVLNVATGQTTQLTNLDGQHDDRLPSWSPDGATLLYQHRDPARAESLDTWEAYLIPAIGGAVTNVSALATEDTPGPDTDLSWTADGQYVLSSSNPNGTSFPSIYMLPTAGGPSVRATNADFEDGAPCGSPDGANIAFESHRTQDEESPTDLWIIAAPR